MSKVQNLVVALSSCESEYVCLTELCKKIIHLRQLLENIGFPQLEPTTIFQDNKSTIRLAKAPEITRNLRHINIRFHFIRLLIKQKIVDVQFLPSPKMTADLLSKPLQGSPFKIQRGRLMNIPTD